MLTETEVVYAGRVGFGKDMGATRSLRDTDAPGQAMEATSGALLEADRKMTDPTRKFQFWRKVLLSSSASSASGSARSCR